MEETKTYTLSAPNLDEKGNVLYLDEARQARKEMGYTPFENHRNGLGIKNFLVTHVSARKWNWKAVLAVFRMIVNCSAWMKKDGFKSKLYQSIMQFSPDLEKNTSAIVMPLNVDISDRAEKCVVPMDIIKRALREAKYIGAMDTCLCRDAEGCTDYPHDIACLFLSDGGRAIVEHGMGRQVTYEEACARVDKAASYGLVGQSLWVEIEQLIWGFRNDQMDKFMEICFCCPCCCVGMNLSRNAPRSIKSRFHSVGWTAVPDLTACTGCRACEKVRCPQDAISFAPDGKVIINQEQCIGCGICKDKCAPGAIKIKQTFPMREDMHEYFVKDFNLDVKLDQ